MQVFLDVDSISPGANFHEVIEETFAKCGAVVVLIGKRWLERDESMPPFGDSRDVITQEIRFAMESKLPIVPVLVDGATMPIGVYITVTVRNAFHAECHRSASHVIRS